MSRRLFQMHFFVAGKVLLMQSGFTVSPLLPLSLLNIPLAFDFLPGEGIDRLVVDEYLAIAYII